MQNRSHLPLVWVCVCVCSLCFCMSVKCQRGSCLLAWHFCRIPLEEGGEGREGNGCHPPPVPIRERGVTVGGTVTPLSRVGRGATKNHYICYRASLCRCMLPETNTLLSWYVLIAFGCHRFSTLANPKPALSMFVCVCVYACVLHSLFVKTKQKR